MRLRLINCCRASRSLIGAREVRAAEDACAYSSSRWENAGSVLLHRFRENMEEEEPWGSSSFLAMRFSMNR